MSKPAARKPKVFQARLGFHDTVVAVPSQAAALRAWGTHQNLFASGAASIATDQAAIEAALRHPGEVLRRAVGAGTPFSLEPEGLPRLPPARKPAAPAKAPSRAAKAPPPPPAPPDRSQLDAAEAALRELDRRRKQEEAAFARQAAALEAARAAAQAAHAEARRERTAALAAARAAYRKAGGTA